MTNSENNKISFAINNAELVQEDPNSSFSVLSLDFFADGKNLHDLYVSEETLLKTADTIKKVPLVWKYSPYTDDATTHDIEEVACGFVPETAEVTVRKMSDGRQMLSVLCLVWKKFSGRIMDIFRRDGDKPVSVEMTVLETKEREEDGLTELLDYKFEAVTVLSNFVQPAIPLAHATVLQFAQEYEEALKEFSSKYAEIDFKIPKSVRDNAQTGLDLFEEYGLGGSSRNLAMGRFLVKNEHITPEKSRQIYKVLSGKEKSDMGSGEGASPSSNYIAWMLHGGLEGLKFSKKICNQMDECDKRTISYFTGGEVDPTKKEENFVEDEKVKEEQTEEMAVEETPATEEPQKEEMAVETPEEEKQEEHEKGESEEEENKEEGEESEEDDEEEEMAFDFSTTLSLFEGSADFEMLSAEFAKPEGERNYAKVACAFYAKACHMAEECKQMACEKEEMAKKFAEEEEKSKAYMSEFEALKAFKAEKDQEQFNFAVDKVLKGIEEKTEIPQTELETLRDTATKEYNLETFDAWRNMARSRALDFAVKEKVADGVVRYALPFSDGTTRRSPNELWIK